MAENVRLYGRRLEPLKAPQETTEQILDVNGDRVLKPVKTLHRSDDVLIGFTDYTSIVADTQKRCGPGSFLYAKDGKLWRTSGRRILCGNPPYLVGICAPSKAPSAAVLVGQGCAEIAPNLICVDPNDPNCATLDGSGWINADVPEARAYVFTYMTEDGQESAPSPVSTVVDVDNGDGVILTPSDVPPAHAVSRRWYRSLTASDGRAKFFFESERPIAEVTYLSRACVLDLGDVLETEGHLPPPCITGVALFGDMSTVIWSGKDLYLSEPNLPHAYLPMNRKTVLYDIVTVEELTDWIEGKVTFRAIVLTKGLHYHLVGETSLDASIHELEAQHPAITPWGVCRAEGSIVFVTPAGLAVIAGQKFDLLIEESVTRYQWGQFLPEEMQLYFHDGDLLGFTPNGGIILPFQSYASEQKNTLTTHTVIIDAAYKSPETPLYLAQTGLVRLWNRGENMRARWRSSVIVQAGLWHPAMFKVMAGFSRRPTGWQTAFRDFTQWKQRCTGKPLAAFFDEYPEYQVHIGWMLLGDTVEIAFLRDGQEWFRREVLDSGLKRTPRHNKALEWQVEISTNRVVYEVHYQTSGEDLTQEGGHA